MKRITTLALGALLIWMSIPGLLLAQAPPARPVEKYAPVKNIIKISPFHFAEGTFLMSYERMLGGQKSSIMLSAGLHSRTGNNYTSGASTPEFGFQEDLQYRLYVIPPQDISRNGQGFWFFKGFYAGPYLSHRYLQRSVQVWDWILQQNVNESEKLNEVAGGVVMGLQFALGNKFFVDFYTGGGIKRSFGEIRQTQYIPVTQPGYNGVYPKIGFQIGIGL
jgi:hypothetical protein